MGKAGCGTLKSESQIHCLPQVLSVLTLMSFPGEERFQGGTLVGSYNGSARNGELITFEASGVSPEGFYVLLQKDNDGLLEDDRVLQIGEFVAFGGYTANITGCT